MTDNNQIEIADPYAHLTKVLADAVDDGGTITHSQDPPVRVAASEGGANLWALVIGDELVTTFRADPVAFPSTLDLGLWIDEMAATWRAEEEPQPPGFDRGGSAFR